MEHFNDLPKNKQLTLSLKKSLEQRVGDDHALFLTEAEISKKYDVSRTTIRQSIEQLVREGYLYRIQGKGTFIAPKKNQVSIILVVETIGDVRSGSYPQLDFYHGLQQFSKETMLNIILLSGQEFDAMQTDLPLIFKGVNKIIFFRTSASFFKAREFLTKQGYQALFYGSDSHLVSHQFSPKNAYDNESFFIYRESELIKIALDHIVKSGKTKIGIAYSGNAVRFNRFQMIKAEVKRRGLEFKEDWAFEFKLEHAKLEARTAACLSLLNEKSHNMPELIFSTDDWLVPPIYHALGQLGKVVGTDLSIISINNYPFAEILYPALSTIDIPIFNDAKICADQLLGGQAKQTVLISQPKLMARSSL